MRSGGRCRCEPRPTFVEQGARRLRARGMALGAERRLDLERARQHGLRLGVVDPQPARRARAGSASIRAPRAPRRTIARGSSPRARRRRSPPPRRPAPAALPTRLMSPQAVHSCSGPKLRSQISRVRRARVSASSQRPSTRRTSARFHIVRPMSGLSASSRCCWTESARRNSGSAAPAVALLREHFAQRGERDGGFGRLGTCGALAHLQHASTEVLGLVEAIELLDEVRDVAQRADRQRMLEPEHALAHLEGAPEERLGARRSRRGPGGSRRAPRRSAPCRDDRRRARAPGSRARGEAPARPRPSRAGTPPCAPDWSARARSRRGRARSAARRARPPTAPAGAGSGWHGR